jgi:hypothetical protein
VKAKTYDVMRLPFIKMIFGKPQEIVYDAALWPARKVRYSPEMNDLLSEFLRTGQLPAAFLDRVVPVESAMCNSDEYNITYRNVTRDTVIKKKHEIGICPDRYIICENSSTYDNGQVCSMAEITALNVPKAHYRSAVATTCHIAQGQTYNLPYTIYELIGMSKQMAYVALSRGRDVSQFTIAGDREKLAQKVFKPEYDNDVRVSDIRLNQGLIYCIKDSLTQTCYVGKTERDLETRFEEHTACSRFSPNSERWVRARVNLAPFKLDKAEKRHIMMLCEEVRNGDSPLYGYTIDNKQRLPKVKPVKAVKPAKPAKQITTHDDDTKLTELNEEIIKYGLRVTHNASGYRFQSPRTKTNTKRVDWLAKSIDAMREKVMGYIATIQS